MRSPLRRRRRSVGRRALAVVAALMMAAGLVSCAGAGGFSSSGRSINVLMVNNPQMIDLQGLTDKYFTAKTGITVNFTVLPENDLRDKAASEFTSQAGQYDVATLSNFEIPIYSKNHWLYPLDDQVKADPTFDQADIFPSMTKSLSGADGKLYGEPFYGESSFLMYRKDVFAKLGLTMPDRPTWDEVAALAAKADRTYAPDMRGICLRGQPGWGQVFAPLTTVVNTFGGTWFDKDWNAKVDSPEFTAAVQFYVDLVRQHGEVGAPSAGFTECLNALSAGKVAMWYDATSAAGSLEGEGSPVQGKIGYVQAPVKLTKASGWLYTWSWAIEASTQKADDAWAFVSWASSKEYEAEVGADLGWARAPAGKRISTYENADYLKAAGAFAEATKTAIQEADPENPGMQPRPTVGIQFVDIPEFTDLGTKVSQYVSSAIAGQTDVVDAMAQGQKLAEKVADTYRS
ncbi:ABC transporter substrate-binding protein [Nakamurella lactea]|uniref:ABC transporter substrate-binding protein n=1 Tax=Nakamurella lactea TaxID=459515 RepID=UPI00048FE792